ncbi:hypothetical protein Tco_0082372 [Tanacetum coccineum]
MEAYSDSDYAGANIDRKSTTGGCQFLGRRLIFWQCKKQTIVATSTTEAEYVAAANCCGQVLWIQNQMLDYGFNFMKTKIYIDNEKNIERPRLTSTRYLLTLKSLPKIDPKDKVKKKIKENESDTESEDINETKKKFKILAHDEEIARKMQED